MAPLLSHPEGRLMLPVGVRPFRLNWPNIVVIGAYHLVALLAFMPGYFSWGGLIVALVGTHLCGLFGINICYHRLLTHRGLEMPEMAGARHGGGRDVLLPGNAGPLGRGPPPAS